MEKPIYIKMQSAEGISGTSVSPSSSNEIVLELSVKLRVSKATMDKYKSKELDINDLNTLIETRV